MREEALISFRTANQRARRLVWVTLALACAWTLVGAVTAVIATVG
jgi:hypothetical protein